MDAIAMKVSGALAANPNNAVLDKILREIAEVDRKLEAATKSALDTMWTELNSGSIPTADVVKRSLSAQPSPLTQMFLEAALPSDAEVISAVSDAGASAKTDSAHAVVKFFLQALLGQPLGPIDEKIMDHLDSLESVTLPEPDYGFQIRFTFGPGAKKFFTNEVLTVTVKSVGAECASCKFAESGITGIYGTDIKWTPPEANPTIMRIAVPPTAPFGAKKKGRDGNQKKAAQEFVEVKQDSIFRIFEHIDFSKELPSGRTPEEEMELNMELERRGKLATGLILFHQVNAGLPILSLKRLTPDDDDVHEDDGDMFDGMSQDELEDGSFGDEEEEDEEDEDVAPPPKKSAKPEGKGTKPQPDCKQQ